jgi:hypothetical protein
MRVGPQWNFLLGVATSVSATPQGTTGFVPFVGCASFGQVEKLEAPKGTSRSAAMTSKDAQALTYYKSADGIGVLAPRGWYCEGNSGSGGYALFVSPKPIDRNVPGWSGFDGPGVQVYHITGENSGRYEVAEIMARAFPAYRALAGRVWEGIDLPFPSGPYPSDTLTYRSKTIVEYSTPAQTEGLGTHFSWFKIDGRPVAGTAIVLGNFDKYGGPPDVLLLSVRLPPDLARLTAVIIRHAESEAVGGIRK